MPPDLLGREELISVSEPRLQHLLKRGVAKPIFLQGVFPFAGRGFFSVCLLNEALTYEVPSGRRAEIVYMRGGNLSDDLLYLAITSNGSPIRYFAVSPKGDFHVPLVITESHPAGAKLEIAFAAPRAVTGSIVVDAGIIEYAEGI